AYEKSHPESPMLAGFLYRLGNALIDVRRFEDAEPVLARGLALEGGRRPASLILLQISLADVYMVGRRFDEAASLLEAALALAEAHPDWKDALEGVLRRLIRCRDPQGRRTEADELRERLKRSAGH